MFGIFDGLEKSVENALDVTVGLATFGEYGDFSQRNVSKMISDGIEIATIASVFGVGEDLIRDIADLND